MKMEDFHVEIVIKLSNGNIMPEDTKENTAKVDLPNEMKVKYFNAKIVVRSSGQNAML